MFKKVKSNLGLEIDDSSIKVLELSLVKGEKFISASNEVFLEEGIVEQGVIKNPKKLARQLKLAFKSAKPRSIRTQTIHFALPDNLAHIHVFRANIGQGQSIKQIVNNEYQRNIPFSLANGEFSFKVIDKHETAAHNQVSTIIMVAAARKSLLAWQSFFEEQRLKIDYFDIEALAVFRGMFTEHQAKTFAILDINKNYSKFSIFSIHGLEYEVSLAVPGDNSSLESFAKEIDSAVSQVAELIAKEDGDLSIDEIIISGYDSDGLLESLNKLDLDYKFRLGQSVLGDNKIERQYFQVLGLAERAFSHSWEQSDPFLPCIGHTYSLVSENTNKGLIDIDVLAILKKYILMPMLALVFITIVWWFTGTVSTSLDSEQEIKVDITDDILPEDNLPLYMQEEEIIKQVFIKINEIGGPLNVRGGPSTSYQVIGQVDSGSEQVFINEKDNWYNIEWPNEESAWISGDYAVLIK